MSPEQHPEWQTMPDPADHRPHGQRKVQQGFQTLSSLGSQSGSAPSVAVFQNVPIAASTSTTTQPMKTHTLLIHRHILAFIGVSPHN